MQKFAIIVAGGQGLRFGGNIPKQFLIFKELPLLMHSINAFNSYDSQCKILVCLPDEHLIFWKNLCVKYNFHIKHKIIAGGETRFHSVKNGLEAIASSEGLVAIHDGVRPLISVELISNLFKMAAENDSAIPCIPLIDSIRKIDNEGSSVIDRTTLRAIQTPQCFHLEKFKKAYQQTYKNEFTDDASVFESAGNKIHLAEGEKKNIKITTKDDLLIAECLKRSNYC
jgi:2-C-methyl-D-erythritol 4-phosphate cytidylyltransferase